MGRTTYYNELWSPQLAYWMARDGLTNPQIAKEMKIAKRTFENWKARYPEFREAVKRGKQKPDDLVEFSLFQRATGYWHPEDKIFHYQGKIIIENTIKHYPPDVLACIFWLKNRRPERWRDVHNIKIEDAMKDFAEAFDKIK